MALFWKKITMNLKYRWKTISVGKANMFLAPKKSFYNIVQPLFYKFSFNRQYFSYVILNVLAKPFEDLVQEN